MKLAFYGGGDEEDNFELDSLVFKTFKLKKPQMTLIPADSYDKDLDYRSFVGQYSKQKVEKFINFPVDIPYDKIFQAAAFNSDVIHLGGGNTYYFLKYLRKKKMLPLLKQYVKDGGILTGLSAGAIIMTPTINVAGFPKFDCDDNDEGMRNFNSMGLVDFEFFPHYKNSKRYREEMIRYSKTIPYPLYACPDGSGIIINNDETIYFGDVFKFICGRGSRI